MLILWCSEAKQCIRETPKNADFVLALLKKSFASLLNHSTESLDLKDQAASATRFKDNIYKNPGLH